MKVTIIGAGHVGATSAQRIAESNLADVTLVDIVEGLAEGKAQDLCDARGLLGHTRVITGTSNLDEGTEGADIVVLTCGLARKPGMSREDLCQKNKEIISSVSEKVKTNAPDAILIMVTNPLDIMTYVAYKVTGFDSKKVIGMAGGLDSSRFNWLISKELGADPTKVKAIVLGGHGDLMVPLLAKSTVDGKPLNSLLDEAKLNELVSATQKGGATIVGLLKTGSAYYAPSAGVYELVKAIIKDEKKEIYCSCYLNGEYGQNDVYLGVNATIGATGFVNINEIELTSDEKNALTASASKVKEEIAKLNV